MIRVKKKMLALAIENQIPNKCRRVGTSQRKDSGAMGAPESFCDFNYDFFVDVGCSTVM